MASTDFPISVEAIYFAMSEHLLEIKIVQLGRATGQYRAVELDILRLERIVYPDETLPFDVGILPTALTPFDEPFAVLVLGSVSHPINTEVESKLLGGLRRHVIFFPYPAQDSFRTCFEAARRCMAIIPLSQWERGQG
jgi:hypothetical protein